MVSMSRAQYKVPIIFTAVQGSAPSPLISILETKTYVGIWDKRKDLNRLWTMSMKEIEEKRDKNLLIVRYNHTVALLDFSPR